MSMIRIETESFDPLQILAEYEVTLGDRKRRIGASATFVGSMRDYNEGVEVQSMRLEHYPEMTERHLASIADEAKRRWQLDDVLVVHRVGDVVPGDAIVLVAVWSGHRAHAFESCRHIMEDLKSKAPFWKKEVTVDGERWVSNNTPGTSAEFAGPDGSGSA